MVALASIDIMASSARPIEQENGTRQDFLDWCSTYLLPLSHNPRLTAEDLYGARCGLLHTYSPQSSLSRAGRAKLVWYATGDTDHEIVEASGRIQGEPVVAVHLPTFLAELVGAMSDFCRELEAGGKLADRVEARRADLMRYLDAA